MTPERRFPPSPRLRTRIDADFPAPETAEEVARLLSDLQPAFDDPTFVELLQAAIVFAAEGQVAAVKADIELSAIDYRDVLAQMSIREGRFTYGPLAHADWAEVLDRELGTG